MRRLIGVCTLGVVVLAWAMTPYLLPTSIALGPCGRDWTSPSSYAPRASPTESLRFEVGEVSAKLCYGSPSVRGRDIFGGLVPFGELWRTGANEPTRLFTDGPLSIAGIDLPAGRYSLYTEPGPEAWRLYLSSSTFHWGNDIGEAVRAAEVGGTDVPAVHFEPPVEPPVEALRFVWKANDSDSGRLALEWDRTRVLIPVEVGRRRH